jgi:CheY-like chemotaxis protein/nitrogen-specific signal transduction histidine kinase
VTSESALFERIAQLEEQLAGEVLCRQDAEAEARSAAEIKQQFLASMSHELRTPLNGLIGAAELALQLHLPAEAREYVHLIHRSSLALFDVLNGIMDISRLESGQLALQPVVFDVYAVMADTVARYAPAAAGKGLALTLTAGELKSLSVEGDALRFSQVLGHLVGNAIKFTDAGSVAVSLSARNRPSGTCDLTVCVRDTGSGIRPEDSERIFRMFSQGDSSASRAYGGTGLGLAVSQGLAQLMGGALGVSSVHGRGATFIFRVEMPLRAAATTAASAAPAGPARLEPPVPQPARESSNAAGLPVLLVEDNPVNRLLAVRILEKTGCRVDVAENGAVAVQMTRERSYAVIFMDLQMPVMDGLQATVAIRRQEAAGQRVPIVAVTANAMPGDRETCLAAGMDDYLPKPLRPSDLVLALHRWCATAEQSA